MLTQIALNRESCNGRYADVLDAAEALENEYGSATNALAAMARQSDIFRAVQSKEGNGRPISEPIESGSK